MRGRHQNAKGLRLRDVMKPKFSELLTVMDVLRPRWLACTTLGRKLHPEEFRTVRTVAERE